MQVVTTVGLDIARHRIRNAVLFDPAIRSTPVRPSDSVGTLLSPYGCRHGHAPSQTTAGAREFLDGMLRL